MTTRHVPVSLARHQEQLIWQRALRRLEGPRMPQAAKPTRFSDLLDRLRLPARRGDDDIN